MVSLLRKMGLALAALALVASCPAAEAPAIESPVDSILAIVRALGSAVGGDIDGMIAELGQINTRLAELEALARAGDAFAETQATNLTNRLTEITTALGGLTLSAEQAQKLAEATNPAVEH